MARSVANYQQMMAEAKRLHDAGRYAPALELIEQLLKRNRDEPNLLHAAGVACRQLGRFDEARKYLSRAISAGITNIGAHQDLARTYEMLGKFDQAAEVIDRALESNPDDQALLAMRAEGLTKTGRHEEAFSKIEAFVDRDDVLPAVAAVYGMVAPRIGRSDEAGVVLRRALERDGMNREQHARLLFTLGALLDKAEKHDEAWEVFAEANEIARPHFDRAAHARHIDWIIGHWTREHIESLPKPSADTSQLVFIVGMPRSGSSLTEQIIASHPSCFGGGELKEVPKLLREIHTVDHDHGTGVSTIKFDKKRVDRLSASLLRRYRKIAGRNWDRICDKMLGNYAHLGMLSVLAPGARVIHCTRDPLDCCLSAYFLRFGDAIPYAYDLTDIGSVFRDYRRLMDHWREHLPLEMLDVGYEELVADVETGARRIIGFLGLEWDDACLKFHESERVTLTASNEQVRQKIYGSSVARHKAYEKHLGPLVEAIEGRA